MKKIIGLLIVSFVGITTSFAGLFPSVSKPSSPDASMIVLQFGIDDAGKLIGCANTSAFAWVPVVKDSDGNIIKFRVFNGGVDMTTIFYKENLKAGEYTLEGFNHVYLDYGKLDAYRIEKGTKEAAKEAPYDNLPYDVVQFFALDEPVKLNLEPNKIMSFGNYGVKYKYKGGLAGTTDDRWMLVEDETKIILANSEDQSLLNYISSWATKKWRMWNAKNPAAKK